MAFALLSPLALARPARLACGRKARAAARPRVGPVRAGSDDLDRVAAIEDEISRQRAQIAEQRSSIARQRQALESVQSAVVSGARARGESEPARRRKSGAVREKPAGGPGWRAATTAWPRATLHALRAGAAPNAASQRRACPARRQSWAGTRGAP
jgi:hypothetical protein